MSLLSHTVLRRIHSRCILTKINYHSDIDECRFNSHNCSNNAICINTKGSFNCSCKPGYTGNGHSCSGGCLRSFIYLLRLAIPCRVTVTAHTELLGPVTVPSLMRNRPPHSTWPSLSSQRIYLCQGCEMGTTIYPSLSEKTKKSNCLFCVLFCICLRS